MKVLFKIIFLFAFFAKYECSAQVFERTFKSLNNGLNVSTRIYNKTKDIDSLFFNITINNQNNEAVLVSSNELRVSFTTDSTWLMLDWNFGITDPLLMPKHKVPFRKFIPNEIYTIERKIKTNWSNVRRISICYETIFFQRIPKKKLKKFKKCSICRLSLKTISDYEEIDPSFRFMDIFEL